MTTALRATVTILGVLLVVLGGWLALAKPFSGSRGQADSPAAATPVPAAAPVISPDSAAVAETETATFALG